MITTKTFRQIALGFDGADEGAHMGHPDFRAHGRIFATIQTADRGMVKLTPEQPGGVCRRRSRVAWQNTTAADPAKPSKAGRPKR